MIIDEQFDQSTVRLQVGDVFELRLAENPTTGFRWSIAQDGRPVCVVRSEAYQGRGTAPGAGGVRLWTFLAAQAGRSRVEMLYRRAWEGASPAARRFAVTIDVAQRGRAR